MPFLKRKESSQVGVIIKQRAPDEKPDSQEDDKDAAIHACAQDLISAVHAKDVKKTAEALYSAFEIMDSMPHEEGEHTEPHSYDAQNIKAAE